MPRTTKKDGRLYLCGGLEKLPAEKTLAGLTDAERERLKESTRVNLVSLLTRLRLELIGYFAYLHGEPSPELGEHMMFVRVLLESLHWAEQQWSEQQWREQQWREQELEKERQAQEQHEQDVTSGGAR
jgi:hypothetical protein